MGLCGGFSLLLKRPEMMLNEFFDDIFSESPFFLVFSGVIYTKISGFFSDDFYDKKFDFTIKNRFFTKGGPEPGISSETPWKPRVRRPGSLE